MTEAAKRWIKVWDFPTRVFHWALAFFALAAYFTSAGRPYGLQFLLHVTSGYAVVLLLLFRLAWGFVGGEHARFAGFVRGWSAVKEHARGLLRLRGMPTLGHNAIGSWMILLLLTTLALLVATGLLTEGKTGGTGPLTGLLPQALMGPVGELHLLLGNFILILAGVHLAGVVVESLLLRENLAGAMVTGRKPAAAEAEGHGRPAADAKEAHVRRALALVVVLALLAGYMAGTTRIPPNLPVPAKAQSGN